MMTGAQWTRLQELFDSASAIPLADRPGFLVRHCGSDITLRRGVEELLSWSTANVGPADPAASVVSETAQALFEECGAGRHAGPYRLIRQLAQGGMGAVYLAERDDGEFRRQVAVKLVRPLFAPRRAMIERFFAERQILAQLNHPNIALMLDGGMTAGGEPYLAMEYVDGIPLDEYCKNLPLRQKLLLCCAVCDAVQYAHRNLVVHRDLKPANILVTAAGVPKLLDFGIAKLMESGGEVTVPAERMLTPGFASPEQILGEPVTTSADIYALGVILYAVVSGRMPLAGVRETLDGVTPAKPTGDADLDTVILKAIHRDPARRYASVLELEQDLRRYLDGFPVAARGDSWPYRAGKFVRRNLLASLAAVLLVAALSGALIVARVAQAKAERRFGEVRALANTLVYEISDAVGNIPGAIEVRKLLVQRGLTYLDRLAAESAGDLSLQSELASAYDRIREVQFHVSRGNLGDTVGAFESARKVIALREKIAAAQPANLDARRQLANAYAMIASLTTQTRGLKDAEPFLAKSRAIREENFRRAPDDPQVQTDLAEELALAGVQAQAKGDTAAAALALRRSVDLNRKLVSASPADAARRNGLGLALLNLGDVSKDRLDDAIAAYAECLQTFERLTRETAPNNLGSRQVANYARLRLAGRYLAAGRVPESSALVAAAVTEAESLSAADPTDLKKRLLASTAYEGQSKVLERAGDLAGALRSSHRSLAVRREVLRKDPENRNPQQLVCGMLPQVARLERMTGAMPQARAHLNEAATLCASLAAADPARPVYRTLQDQVRRESAEWDRAAGRIATK